MSDLTITFLGGVALAGFLAWLATADKIPTPAPAHLGGESGCTLVTSIKTDELKYCGKACWMAVYVNTYQCPTGQKILVE